MVYTIIANNKSYTVIDHAIEEMLKDDLTDEIIIAVLEGEPPFTQQRTGRDIYEGEVYDEKTDEWINVRVVVDETNKIIVTVMIVY